MKRLKFCKPNGLTNGSRFGLAMVKFIQTSKTGLPHRPLFDYTNWQNNQSIDQTKPRGQTIAKASQ